MAGLTSDNSPERKTAGYASAIKKVRYGDLNDHANRNIG
jgi:hypothetical protein